MRTKRIRQRAAWIVCAAVATLPIPHWVRAETSSFDFESDTVGSPPAGWFVVGNNFNYVTNSNAYAGNNALFFTLYNGGFSYNFTNAILKDLSVGSVDFYMKFNQAEIDNSWGVQLTDGTNGTGNGGYVMFIYPGNANFLGSYNYGAGAFNTGVTATTGVYHHIEIKWDVHQPTDYLTWIWDNSVTNFSNTIGPDLLGVRSVTFYQGGAAGGDKQLFLDNVTFTAVPEPTALSLVVLGCSLAWWRGTRKQ